MAKGKTTSGTVTQVVEPARSDPGRFSVIIDVETTAKYAPVIRDRIAEVIGTMNQEFGRTVLEVKDV